MRPMTIGLLALSLLLPGGLAGADEGKLGDLAVSKPGKVTLRRTFPDRTRRTDTKWANQHGSGHHITFEGMERNGPPSGYMSTESTRTFKPGPRGGTLTATKATSRYSESEPVHTSSLRRWQWGHTTIEHMRWEERTPDGRLIETGYRKNISLSPSITFYAGVTATKAGAPQKGFYRIADDVSDAELGKLVAVAKKRPIWASGPLRGRREVATSLPAGSTLLQLKTLIAKRGPDPVP